MSRNKRVPPDPAESTYEIPRFRSNIKTNPDSSALWHEVSEAKTKVAIYNQGARTAIDRALEELRGFLYIPRTCGHPSPNLTKSQEANNQLIARIAERIAPHHPDYQYDDIPF